ncbi:hypothetical protein Mpsy_2294 [Methanolobus psychrophilus R15]|nr:hypothetical protein Mpsy_2294 [Methanolobus psychrophilus R15]
MDMELLNKIKTHDPIILDICEFTNHQGKINLPTLLHRDQVVTDLITSLLPLINGNQAPNILLSGHAKSGKSFTLDKVMQYIYITARNTGNPTHFCEIYDISTAKYKTITKRITTFDDEIAEILSQEFNTYFAKPSACKTYSVIFENIQTSSDLDKIKKIMQSPEIPNLNQKINVIAITNSDNIIENTSPSTLSYLSFHHIEVPPYSAQEITDILNQFSNMFFRQGSISNEVIPLCASLAIKNDNNIEYAITLLKNAALLTEKEFQSIVTESYIDLAAKLMQQNKICHIIYNMPTNEKLILQAMVKKYDKTGVNEMLATEILSAYVALCKKYKFKETLLRQTSRNISKIEASGLISSTIKQKNTGKGRYKSISFAENSLHYIRIALNADNEMLDIMKNSEGA